MKELLLLLIIFLLLSSCGTPKRKCIEYTYLTDIEFLTVGQGLIGNDKTYTILRYKNGLIRKIDGTWVQNIGQKHCIKS